MQYLNIDDTFFCYFASNDTAGSGNDGASAVFDVRLAGASASAAPVVSGNATLLTHANYPAGAYEVEQAVTVANGFAAGAKYAVFCTLAVDSQNPTGFIGEFQTAPVLAGLADDYEHGGPPGASTATWAGDHAYFKSATHDAFLCETSAANKTGIQSYSSHSTGVGTLFSGGAFGFQAYGDQGGTAFQGDTQYGLSCETFTTGSPIQAVVSGEGDAISVVAAGSGKLAIKMSGGISANATGLGTPGIEAIGDTGQPDFKGEPLDSLPTAAENAAATAAQVTMDHGTGSYSASAAAPEQGRTGSL